MRYADDIEALLGAAPIDDNVTADTLAAFLGLSSRRVAQLAEQGVIPKSGVAAFPLQASVRAYVESLRTRSTKPASVERERLAREQADAVALRNAKARGELVAVADVAAEWGSIVRDVRAAMLALPSRVGARLGDLTPTHVREIDSEIRRALTALGSE